MQKETVSTPKKRSSLKIYAIKGFCTRLGGQDDDGIDNEDVRLEVASDSEALEQFRALIEEKKHHQWSAETRGGADGSADKTSQNTAERIVF